MPPHAPPFNAGCTLASAIPPHNAVMQLQSDVLAIRAVLSSDAVSSSLPSGEKHSARMGSACTSSSWHILPALQSQREIYQYSTPYSRPLQRHCRAHTPAVPHPEGGPDSDSQDPSIAGTCGNQPDHGLSFMLLRLLGRCLLARLLSAHLAARGATAG